MKRILLFLVLFCSLTGIVFAEEPEPELEEEPGKIHFQMVNFDDIYIQLKQNIIELLRQNYVLLLGFLVTMFILKCIKEFTAGREKRLKSERKERERKEKQISKRDESERTERLLRERELIRRYSFGDDEVVERIQTELHRLRDQEGQEPEYKLAPSDKDVYGSNIDRGRTFWRSDGSEEGTVSLYEDTVTFGSSSTVDLRQKYRSRFRRGMDDDEGGGY